MSGRAAATKISASDPTPVGGRGAVKMLDAFEARNAGRPHLGRDRHPARVGGPLSSGNAVDQVVGLRGGQRHEKCRASWTSDFPVVAFLTDPTSSKSISPRVGLASPPTSYDYRARRRALT
jgi:hypothetical protein